jgi:hypothetical protein
METCTLFVCLDLFSLSQPINFNIFTSLQFIFLRNHIVCPVKVLTFCILLIALLVCEAHAPVPLHCLKNGSEICSDLVSYFGMARLLMVLCAPNTLQKCLNISIRGVLVALRRALMARDSLFQ